jgi:hypothetical protein
VSRQRTPESIARSKRTKEGGDFEQFSVPAALRAEGYEVVFADKSRGPFDHLAVKPGQLLVIGARLTPLGGANPHFDDDEWSALWEFAEATSMASAEVVPLIATARHAGGPPGGTGKCRCAREVPDSVRYMRLVGPKVAGAGKRPPWVAWSPDFALAASA